MDVFLTNTTLFSSPLELGLSLALCWANVDTYRHQSRRGYFSSKPYLKRPNSNALFPCASNVIGVCQSVPEQCPLHCLTALHCTNNKRKPRTPQLGPCQESVCFLCMCVQFLPRTDGWMDG
ncbi:hypothetical protein BJ741DRAFT_606547 [Chytriomyces cf. hyalinus JEL632]|nr:hypothetical protein BJ741DRAFT_606547 [Chytriomyces cf. hyalinus JEL632]